MSDAPSVKRASPDAAAEDASPAPRPTEWVRVAVGVAATGYTLVGTYDLVMATTGWDNRLSQAAVALLCLAAFPLSRRWPRAAAAVVIGAVWLQLVWTLVIAGTPPPGLLAFPVLVVGTGLLVGGGASLALGAASALVIPIAFVTGRAMMPDLGPLKPIEFTWLVVADVCTVGVGLMTRAALGAYQRVLEASETARRRYRQLFQDAPDGLVELDEQGRIVEANAEARRVLGGHDGVVGADFAATLRVLGVVQPPDLALARPGLPLPIEVPGPAGAARLLELGVGSEAGPTRRRLVLRDVTERRFLEERLGHAQRLETVGQLAGGVAHDFNNLLTVVGGNASQLAEHADAEVRQLSSEILDAQERGAALTRQLLAFGRREVRQPLQQDLAAVISGISRLLGRLLGEQHRLRLVLDGPAPVFADRGQLEQVALNLVTNARDAMPGGGEVELSVRLVGREEAARLGTTLEAERQVLLQVEDGGVGMSAETLRHVFQPFFTTKPRGKGTGLGLATVHGIVSQSGGCVAVDSVPARGTRFRVFLPEVAAGATPGPARGARPAPAAGTERILLVEDDAGVLALARRTLERAGYRVTAATGGGAAEAAGRAGRFDLLLTDVLMPGTDGIELARRLLAWHPGLRVLLVSGYSDVDASEPPAAPPHPLLQKPFEPAELLRRVRAVLDGA